ncbi:MAG: YfhO family protein, partial [Chloroflexota bacterium]|nr:YfhO family protein [Chloroflexota bacterium]
LGGAVASAAALLVLVAVWAATRTGSKSSLPTWVADLWRSVRGVGDAVDLPRLSSASAWGIANIVVGLVGLALLWAGVQLRGRSQWPLLAVYLAILLELLLLATPSAYAGGLDSREIFQRLGSSNLEILSRTEERVAIGMHYSRFSNAGDLFGFRSVTAWDPLLLARTTGLLRASQDFVDPHADASNEIFLNHDGGAAFDVLGVRYFIREDDGRAELLPRVAPLPRLTLVPSARLVSGPQESLEAVLAPGFEPRAEVILESPAPRIGTPREAPEAAGVAVLETEPGRVRARVAAPADSYLLFSESYYPGWRAEAGGASVQPVPADHAIMAVRVPPGTHEVRFQFTAPWLAPTLGLAVVGLGGLLLLWRGG